LTLSPAKQLLLRNSAIHNSYHIIILQNTQPVFDVFLCDF